MAQRHYRGYKSATTGGSPTAVMPRRVCATHQWVNHLSEVSIGGQVLRYCPLCIRINRKRSPLQRRQIGLKSMDRAAFDSI